MLYFATLQAINFHENLTETVVVHITYSDWQTYVHGNFKFCTATFHAKFYKNLRNTVALVCVTCLDRWTNRQDDLYINVYKLLTLSFYYWPIRIARMYLQTKPLNKESTHVFSSRELFHIDFSSLQTQALRL